MSWSSRRHDGSGSGHKGVDDIVWHVSDWVDKHIECLWCCYSSSAVVVLRRYRSVVKMGNGRG